MSSSQNPELTATPAATTCEAHSVPLPAEAELSQLSDGEEGLISHVSTANPELRRRLYALGFVPGASVTKLRVAPLGDPLQVRIGGSSVSIRAREAAAIRVQQQAHSPALQPQAAHLNLAKR